MNSSELKKYQKKLAEIELKLILPENFSDSKKIAELNIEYTRIKNVIDIVERLENVNKELDDAKHLLASEGDGELLALAQTENDLLLREKKKLEIELDELLTPPDPDAERNVIIEIRAGTGGDEAALFAGDLLRMYSRFAEKRGWKVHMLSINQTDLRGIKEVIIKIQGKGAYKSLKNESGVHRVQRIPETEKEGRIHTSTSTVAVLPEVEDVEIIIEPKDLRIDTFLASGKGGQNVQKNETAVRITHLPTGLAVASQSERSQLQNKENAMSLLRSRLYNMKKEAELSARSADRKSQIGSAERSEKIRTYNFPQDRVTDHRVNESCHGITEFMDGNLDEFFLKISQKLKENNLLSKDDNEK